jgi:uncharacterized membrane protein
MTRIFIGAPILLMGLVLLLMPNVMRRGTYFGAAVPDGFRSTSEGRRATGIYRGWVALALALAFLAWWIWPTALTTALSPLAMFLVGAVAYYRAHGLIAPFAVNRSAGERSVELSETPERLPRWTWAGVGPFVLLALAALFLNDHWSSLPVRFPVHFGLDGTPDRWVEKSFRGVYGPLILGGEICALLIAIGVSGWFGARRTALRANVLGLLIITEYWLALLFSVIALQPVLDIPAWAIVIPTLSVPFLAVAYAMRKAGAPSDPSERTPENCWKFGVFYYNPNDAALFVERRTGFGYTINFGNRWSWAFSAGLIAVIATIPAVLP